MNALIEEIGRQVDIASDDKDADRLRILSKQCQNVIEDASSIDKIILKFFEANCYGALVKIESTNEEYLWSWNNDERVSEILALRQAVSNTSFSSLPALWQCKILTNLGNRLNNLGRFVDALKYWDSALQIMPNFAMALGNKGIGLIYYGQSLYDYSHTGILTAAAKNIFKQSISKDALWDSGEQPDVKAQFTQYYNSSVKYLDNIQYDIEFDLDQWTLGNSEEEVNYKQWCLNNRLFLSPLNDILKYSAAAQDVIHLPNHKYKIDEPARFPNYYNLLKQEYVTARYMLYEAMNTETQHISDNDVLLLSGHDGVEFGYRTEQLKIAYRLTYSIFDKIALFLNDYFSVGLNPGSVSFRKVWGKVINKEFELHTCFANSKNSPLRGLYYLSKDLFDEDYVDVALPDAQELASLRNRIEHRFLSLQEYAASVQDTDIHSYITISDFEDKTLRILSMAREALIYLSLAMHREEAIRNQTEDDEQLSVSVFSVPIERK